MKRGGKVEDMRWFRGPDRSFFHFLNAFSDGDKVHVDFTVSAEVPFPFIREASGPQRSAEDGAFRAGPLELRPGAQQRDLGRESAWPAGRFPADRQGGIT